MCTQIQKVGAIQAQNRGFDTVVSPAMGLPLNSTACAMCGQCTVVCPTGALKETDGLAPVWRALADPEKRVVVQVAPAVRAAWVKSSACRWEPLSPGKWQRLFTKSGLTMCLTPCFPPTLLYWRRELNF